jgi:hypothetical protein
MKRDRIVPTHYIVCVSIVSEKRGAEWVAVVTDMPVKATGSTRKEAERGAQLAAIRAMAEGDGPIFSEHHDVAAGVAQAVIESMWRFISNFMREITKERTDGPLEETTGKREER